jgi:mannose-6-phosphate isomerase
VLQPPDPGVVLGVREGTTKDELRRRIGEGTLEECLHYESVKCGDMVFCPAGTLHAAVPPMVMVEIQQSSDTTYRVYDWNRVGLDGKPRELHVEQALEALDLAPRRGLTPEPTPVAETPFRRELLVDCDKFAVSRWTVASDAPRGKRADEFEALVCIGGDGEIATEGAPPVRIALGDTILVPACVPDYSIRAASEMTLLHTVGK